MDSSLALQYTYIPAAGRRAACNFRAEQSHRDVRPSNRATVPELLVLRCLTTEQGISWHYVSDTCLLSPIVLVTESRAEPIKSI